MVKVWLAVKCIRLKHIGFIDDINLVVVYLKRIHLISTISEIHLIHLSSLLMNIHHMKFICLLKLCNLNG